MNIWNQRCVVGLMIFGIAAMCACAASSDDENPADFRCTMQRTGGGCFSIPSDCAFQNQLPHLGPSLVPDKPACEDGAKLVPTADDPCVQKLSCDDIVHPG